MGRRLPARARRTAKCRRGRPPTTRPSTGIGSRSRCAATATSCPTRRRTASSRCETRRSAGSCTSASPARSAGWCSRAPGSTGTTSKPKTAVALLGGGARDRPHGPRSDGRAARTRTRTRSGSSGRREPRAERSCRRRRIRLRSNGIEARARRAARGRSETRPPRWPWRPPSTLSVTAFLTFVRDEEEFFWRYVRRVPSPPSPAAELGIELHRRIEQRARAARSARSAPPRTVEEPYDLDASASAAATASACLAGRAVGELQGEPVRVDDAAA